MLAHEIFENYYQPDASMSGVPIVVTSSVRIVPLHVSDTRSIAHSPEWEHAGFWVSKGGDVEYHVYHRREVSFPQVFESVSN